MKMILVPILECIFCKMFQPESRQIIDYPVDIPWELRSPQYFDWATALLIAYFQIVMIA
jgi:hypothetical protein